MLVVDAHEMVSALVAGAILVFKCPVVSRVRLGSR